MDPNATVNLLMNFPGMWNTCYIKQYFLPVDVDKILAVPLCDGSRGYVAVWHFNENDRYSVKSGYWFGMELRRLEEGSSSGSGYDTSNSTNIWSLIWDLSVPNKVKLFLWRACHAFLPCAERLFKRKIRSHGGCDRCGDREEFVIHSLWYCQVARKLWKCSPWREKDRNEVLHGKRGMDPRKIFEKCMDWQCEIVRVELERKNSLRGSVREREEVSENGEDGNNNLSKQVATLFFDGACDSKAGMAGLGAIIMSGSGNQLGALAFPRTAVLKPHIIEALALWYGLKLSKQVGVSKLTIVGDAINVIHAIGQSGLDLSDIGGVMDAVRSLKSEFEWISWKHVRKRKNQIAHTLARRALKMDQALLCFDSWPPWLQELISKCHRV
ncbi:hypothetical protein ACLB2K_042225 [Fragaria x ananassa]